MSVLFPVVISAPSGGGKTTIKNEIIKRNKLFKFNITCTTRPKRKGEIDGKDYYFISDKEFDRMIKNGEFLEWARVHNWRYGTPRKSVDKAISEGYFPIMTIDVNGAMSVKKIYPDSVLIFLIPPSPQALVDRLKKRGELMSDIKLRMKTAIREIKKIPKFDYIVVNDDIKKTAKKIENIVFSNLCKISNNMDIIKRFIDKASKITDYGGVK
ncbi:MAG: guanylate kinase [Elusimicrobiota bacterium]